MLGAGEVNQKKATSLSLIAGVVFGIAWWIYVDGSAIDSTASGYHWLPGVGSTIAFVMINAMHWPDLTDDEGSTAVKARAFLIVAMMLGIGCIAAALIIMLKVFVNGSANTWTGVALLVQNVLIFVSSFVMRFGTAPDTSD